MSRTFASAALLALAAAAIASASARAAVPTTIGFTARLVDDESGDAIKGAQHLTFGLYAAASGGDAEWTEQKDITVEDGLVVVALGETTALDATVLDGRALFLEVSVGDTKLEPRIPLASVPYSVRAGDADSIGGVGIEGLQERISGNCAVGTVLTGVNDDGTVTCQPDQQGSGDITGVTAGNGLEGGGGNGDVTLRLLSTCTVGQVLKWSGTAWQCGADIGATGGTGDITAVTVGPAGGLSGGATQGDAVLSLLSTCGMNQILKWNGSTWACAPDLDTDTNSGGDITSVSTTAQSGLTGGVTSGDAAISLITTCAMGQLLKWNGTGWACASDIDTDTDTNSGGDITDVIAGAGLTGGATTGSATVNVVGGSGVVVAADSVSLDFTALDARWVNATGDQMTGLLDMNQNRLLNRGCPANYFRAGPGLCLETTDASPFTFTQCANRCRAAGTHLCSSADMRGFLASGIALPSGGSVTFDWLDDQDADGSALYLSSSTAEDPDGARVTSTTSVAFCRCCANVE